MAAERATVHDFEKEKFFEGCLPIEVMAHRGVDTLRFGPMKPVGLIDPRTGRQPYAVVQLRQDNLAADHFSLVGFQTQLKWGEQARVFRMIPGLEQRRVRALRPRAPQHVHQRPDWCSPRRGRCGRARGCSSPARSPGSKATSSRRRRGCSRASTRRRWPRGASRRRRHGRRRSARWRTTRRTRTRSTISRATSRSGSWRRWKARDRRLKRDRKARNEAISARALDLRSHAVVQRGGQRMRTTGRPGWIP